MTDRALLEEIQRLVVEPPDLGATWPSGLWTRAEVVGYATQRQQRLLQETLVSSSWHQQDLVFATQQPLPQDWMLTFHAIAEVGGTSHPLAPLSRRDADLQVPTWQSTGATRALGYLDQERGTLTLELVPLPTAAGLLHLFGCWLAETFTGNGITLAIPEELTPYLLYGTLADMLGKEGRAFDGPRRDYCELRWAEGVAVGRAMVEGVVFV